MKKKPQPLTNGKEQLSHLRALYSTLEFYSALDRRAGIPEGESPATTSLPLVNELASRLGFSFSQLK